MTGYATRDVSELIGFNADQVRHYVRRGLLTPERGGRGEYRFSFQDVVLLRTAKGLLDAQVSSRRAYRVLLKLKSELTAVKSLSAVRIFADGNNVVVREDSSTWNAESGQGHLNFAVQRTRGQRCRARSAQNREAAGNRRTRQRRLVQPGARSRGDRTGTRAGSVSARDRARSDQRRRARQPRPSLSDERPTQGRASLLPQSARVRLRSSARAVQPRHAVRRARRARHRGRILPSGTCASPTRTTTSRASAKCAATSWRRCDICGGISSCSKRSTDSARDLSATSIGRLERRRFGAPDTQESHPWRSPRAIPGA